MATINDDQELRGEAALEWSDEQRAEIKPGQIVCTGCRSQGAKSYYCEQICEVRKCALARDLEQCIQCPEYGCNKLSRYMHVAPSYKRMWPS